MEVVFNKKDFIGYPFTESYVNWINKSIENASVEFSDTQIKITANSEFDLSKAALFIGYAWGQQDNGR